MRRLHAVTLRAANGAEILMHIGLDTVALGGRGFTAHVAKGQRVQAGDRLISFDLDQLAQSARSLITPIVITNGEEFSIVARLENARVAHGQELMTLRPLVAVTAIGRAPPAAKSAASWSCRWRMAFTRAPPPGLPVWRKALPPRLP